MFSDLLIHPQTKRQLDSFINSPSHALSLYGPKGSGKRTLALAIAGKLLNQDLSNVHSPNLIHITKNEGKQDITIDEIRAMRKSLRLTQPGRAAVRRVVLIENAQEMNQEAQNALLKSLEEPPAGTVFILTLVSPAQLLPTVMSRTQQVSVMPVSLAAAKKYFEKAKNLEANWQISRGMPGLLSALVGAQKHELLANISQAKEFIIASRYERALQLHKISKDRGELMVFLEALSLILRPLYRSRVSKEKTQAAKLVAASKQVDAAIYDLSANVSPRLICLKLSLSLPI